MGLTAASHDAARRMRWLPLQVGDRLRPGDVVLCGQGDEVVLAFSVPLVRDYLGIDADYVLPELFAQRSAAEVFLTVAPKALLRVALPQGIGATAPHPDAWVRELRGTPLFSGDLRAIAAAFDERELFARAPETKTKTAAADSSAATAPSTRRIGIAAYPRMGPRSGVVIERVFADSAAARAGLRSGDRIVAADGQAIRDLTELKQVLETGRGHTVVLSVRRRGEDQPALVELGL